MLLSLQVTNRGTGNHSPPLSPAAKAAAPSSTAASVRCALTKQSQRLLRDLSVVAGDPAVAGKLISKFVASSPKSASLATLSHLLSPRTAAAHPGLPSLAVPLYSKVREASWFQLDTKLAADVAALLEKRGQVLESEAMISEVASQLKDKNKELALFYCHLVDSHSNWKTDRGFGIAFDQLKQIVSILSSATVKRRATESMIEGLCKIGRPDEAEGLMVEMRLQGVKLSASMMRSVVYGYGKLGLFKDMNRILDRMIDEGTKIDTVCANMVLASYGNRTQLNHMVSWLKRMNSVGIPFSISTYNTVLISCPTIMSMVNDNTSDTPLSMAELAGVLNGEEGLAVKELVDSSVLFDVMGCTSSEAKLDLHGMHVGSAFLIMLQWMDEMRVRLSDEQHVALGQMTVVCGSGKHSKVRGESPVKKMVKRILNGLRSPMRIDMRNPGCFICKGRALKQWLCT